MLPILFHFGPVTIYSFGVFVALATIVGLFTFWHFSKHFVMSQEDIFDGAFLAIAGGFIGARVLYIIMHPWLLRISVFTIFDVFHFPGFVYYGALLGGLLALTAYFRNQKLGEKGLFDAAALAVSVAHAIGLVGAFLGGTAYGTTTSFFWAVPMVGLVSKRQPVQLIEAAVEIIIFIVLAKLFARKRKAGILAVFYIIGYAFCRYFIEWLRGDSVYWFTIKSQFILSGVILLFGLLYLKRRFLTDNPKLRPAKKI